MKSHEALQEAIDRQTVEHAKALQLSASAVHKWQEPSTDFTDSGSLNPLDRVETIINTAVRLGRSQNPYAPIHYLAAKCNHVAIPIPKPSANLKSLTNERLDAVKEFGKMSEEAAKAMIDDEITTREVERIEKKAHAMFREVMEFLEAAKERVR